MRGFGFGVIVTLVALVMIVIAVSQLGRIQSEPIIRQVLSSARLRDGAMDVYADKHKPAGDNPIAPTAANLTEGAQALRGALRVVPRRRQGEDQPDAESVQSACTAADQPHPARPASWIFWVTKHGVRMTGMPAWTGILSDDDIWKIVAFIKNSGKLPPETQAAWQASAANR
jgi:hypothetical protein